MAISSSKFSFIHAANVWSGDEGWGLLFYYNLYRLGLAVVLIAIAIPGFDYRITGTVVWGNPILIVAITGFCIVSIVAFFSIRQKSPAIHIQAHTLFLLDILLISSLALADQLDASNIIIFYVTTIAATAIMFRTKTALAYACITTLVIYGRNILDYVHDNAILESFYISGLSATGLFSIVVIVSHIARRTRAVQNVLEQQELELADLDDINQIIIDQLEIGVMFLEDNQSIKLINLIATDLVGDYIRHGKISNKFARLLRTYQKMPSGKHFTFRHRDKVLRLSSTAMRSGTLIRIEDRTTLSRKIQQTKLSSVGRFASAISHEIRNPLNAINHAAQLIQPDEHNPENTEMVEMIRKHSRRINNIIESILDRSRPGKVKQQELNLTAWNNDFIETFKQTIDDEEVLLCHDGEDQTVYFDPVQLEQILTNLCQNSIKYGKTLGKLLEISIITGKDDEGVTYMDVMDNGPAIAEAKAEKLFEPFYTTQAQSTGLGLYLSKQFCILNGADIEYFNDIEKHGFRISFKLQEMI